MSDRLISTDKVAEAIDWLNEYDFVLWDEVMKCIDKVPTVDAVRHGHWIWHGSYYTCSVCGEEQYGVDTGRFYCQNCGAKMDEQSTVDIEKHGRWLKTGQSFVNPNKFKNYFCSECGLELDEHIRSKPNYCPNCGAKMDG